MKHISLSDLDPLKEARADLGESETYGSEPDLILVTNQYVILLEAKFTAPVLTQADKIPPITWMTKKVTQQLRLRVIRPKH